MLTAAASRLEAWRAAGAGGPSGDRADRVLEVVRNALDDDLDVPAAIAAIDSAAAQGRPVGAAAALLGVSL
jgi:hypothetical protein